MRAPILILDANLLVLLVVGRAAREYIGKHKRLRAYSVSDFDLLIKLLSSASKIVITPNTLTETSNLVRQISEPARAQILLVLRELIARHDEHYRDSRSVSKSDEFPRLGLTDAVLLDIAGQYGTLLTTDLDLYVAAVKRGYKAVNFNHYRGD